MVHKALLDEKLGRWGIGGGRVEEWDVFTPSSAVPHPPTHACPDSVFRAQNEQSGAGAKVKNFS